MTDAQKTVTEDKKRPIANRLTDGIKYLSSLETSQDETSQLLIEMLRDAKGEIASKHRMIFEQPALTFIRTLSDKVNGQGSLAEEMIEAMSTEHRTLQASIIRDFFKFLTLYADSSSDGRNEYAVEICQMVKDMKIYIPYI
jgi:hypothetical protein